MLKRPASQATTPPKKKTNHELVMCGHDERCECVWGDGAALVKRLAAQAELVPYDREAEAHPTGALDGITGRPPYHVSVLGRANGAGTREDPVAEVVDAERLLREFCERVEESGGDRETLNDALEEVVCIVACQSPSCELLSCSVGRCGRTVCSEHGTGRGYSSAWTGGDTPIIFAACVCREGGCDRAFCDRHWDRARTCDGCNDDYLMYCHLAGLSAPTMAGWQTRYCPKHTRRCRGKDSYGDPCRLRCCQRCSATHECNLRGTGLAG